MSFWGELKRRNIYKVGVAYAIVAWLIIQAAAIVSPALQLPKWTLPFVIVILCICFPLILLFAWAFEITPDGIKRTRQVPLSESITHLTGKKLNYILVGVIVLAIAYIVFDKVYIDRRAHEPKIVSTETDQAPVVADVEEEAPKTIAVLPFDDLSPENDQEYFVLGLSEEILNYLSKISGLHVTSKTSSFTFKNSDKTIQEIAGILGVAHIIEGSVRKAGDALRITAQLIHVADDRHIWSETYDRELKDIFAVQEDIATAIADELKATLGIGKSLKQLGGTDNVEAYEIYLVGKGLMSENTPDSMRSSLGSFDAAIVLDPKFALAWAKKAEIHNNISHDTPANSAGTERDAALRAAQKAIELDPNLAGGYYNMGTINLSKGDFIEAEKAFNKALELTTGGLSGFEILIGVYYQAIGYFKNAREIFEEIRQNDPLNRPARAQYLLNLAFLDYSQRAEEEYKRGRQLFGDQWNLGDTYISYVRLGSSDTLSRNKIIISDYDTYPHFIIAKEYLDSPGKALTELRSLYANDSNLSSGHFFGISILAAYFGDPEFAMEAVERGFEIESSGLFLAWLPVMHEVRQLPRFKEFVREIGLVDYWNEFGWPDICRPLDNGDFECD